jgi:hypothetical protein
VLLPLACDEGEMREEKDHRRRLGFEEGNMRRQEEEEKGTD